MNKYRQLLIERQRALLAIADSGRQAAGTVELDQARVGRLSRMDALQAQAMSKETGRRRELELTRIRSALKRLDDGDYGYCLRCDEPISAGRLEVDPSVSLCIACASKDDR